VSTPDTTLNTVPREISGRPTLDVSPLPSFAFGHRNVSWLGNVLYMTIEGTMFALVVASYFYLRTRTVHWPPGNHEAPVATIGLINLAIFLVSVVPARLIQKRAMTLNKRAVTIGLVVLTVFGTAAIVLRGFEFASLNCRWTDNAYASCVWILLGLHTGHLITEWIETIVITAMSAGSKMVGGRFADASTNSDYWYFVVGFAVITDVIIYGTTRWL
jgi:cytochrome c oxidase subunit III